MSYVTIGALTLLALVASIAEGDPDSPAMVIGGILASLSMPVWITTGALAAISLIRREPRPLIAAGLLVICAVLVFIVAPTGLKFLRDAVESFG